MSRVISHIFSYMYTHSVSFCTAVVIYTVLLRWGENYKYHINDNDLMMSVQNRDVSAVFFSSCAHCCVIICVRNVHCTYICIVFVHIYLHHLRAHKGVIRLFLLPVLLVT